MLRHYKNFQKRTTQFRRQMNMQENKLKFKFSTSVAKIKTLNQISSKTIDPSRVKLKLDLESEKVNLINPILGTSSHQVEEMSTDLKDVTLKEIVSQESVLNMLYIPETQSLIPDVQLEGFSVFPGSFNPLHIGHIELAARAADELSEGKVVFELSIGNADKGFITNDELMKRIAYFENSEYPLIINKAGLFKDKLVYNKNGYFLMGVDTFKRVFDKKYYSTPEEIADFCTAMINRGMKIAVGGRIDDNKDFRLAQDYLERVPEFYRSFIYPIEGYRVDLSSTDIRNGEADAGFSKEREKKSINNIN